MKESILENSRSETEGIEIMAPTDWTPISSMIKVVGVGGGGCNAVSYMYSKGIQGCQFLVCNTDHKTLDRSKVPNQIRIGDGLGTGTRPEKAREYALEDAERIRAALVDPVAKMVFVTASLGGGTGTGAAPVVAEICKQAGILTVGVVTLPFSSEGRIARMRALDGLDAMRMSVDSLIVIDNTKLYSYYGDLSLWDAFHKVDEVLSTAVEGILGIIEKTGYINVDLNDVHTMMRDSGMALMGCGSGTGENRVSDAIETAIDSPLLNNYDLKKATKVLVNITCSASSQGLKMAELSMLESKISECLGVTENYKKGIVFDDDPEFGDRIDVTIIATGVEMMGAVPEDYYSEQREFVPVKPEPEKTDEVNLDNSQNPDAVPDVKNDGPDVPQVEHPVGLMRIVARIKSEVTKMYDSLGEEENSPSV